MYQISPQARPVTKEPCAGVNGFGSGTEFKLLFTRLYSSDTQRTVRIPVFKVPYSATGLPVVSGEDNPNAYFPKHFHFHVDWGDGTSDEYKGKSFTCQHVYTFANHGIGQGEQYSPTITIRGYCPVLQPTRVSSSLWRNHITEIKFGNNGWFPDCFQYRFKNHPFLAKVSYKTQNGTEVVRSLSNTFAENSALTDVDFLNFKSDNLTNLSGTFRKHNPTNTANKKLNVNCDKLDVRRVTNMSQMFWKAAMTTLDYTKLILRWAENIQTPKSSAMTFHSGTGNTQSKSNYFRHGQFYNSLFMVFKARNVLKQKLGNGTINDGGGVEYL